MTEETRTIQAVQDDLLALTRYWTVHEDVPRSQQLKAAMLGRELDKLGGFDAMRNAYYIAKANNNAVAVLQAYWDGIGDWRW